MADINNPIKYQKDRENLIKKLLTDPTFSHTNWSDDQLEEYRKSVRDHYRKEQGGKCAYCKQNISLVGAGNAHVEHIVSKSRYKNFMFTPKNLCVICCDCNTIKRNQEVLQHDHDVLSRSSTIQRYPHSSGAFLIVHPHFDVWNDHILNFGSLYVDLTDKGLFTIGVCTLNRVLREFGWEAIVASEAEIRGAASSYLNATDAIVASRHLQVLKRLLVTI